LDEKITLFGSGTKKEDIVKINDVYLFNKRKIEEK